MPRAGPGSFTTFESLEAGSEAQPDATMSRKKERTERRVGEISSLVWPQRKKLSVSASLWVFVYSAPAPHLHESWLLSSSSNDEMKEGVPVSLSTYYQSCWEIWSPSFFPGWNTRILPLFHLFMTVLWLQTYAMSPREMEATKSF